MSSRVNFEHRSTAEFTGSQKTHKAAAYSKNSPTTKAFFAIKITDGK